MKNNNQSFKITESFKIIRDESDNIKSINSINIIIFIILAILIIYFFRSIK